MSELDLLNVDTDKLFEQYTINEIIDIHKKLQAELDRKKQELRYMVGERYRDVITAADAIKSMQNSAGILYTHIGDINDKSHVLQSSINVEDTETVTVDRIKYFYRSVAIQIKILISIPEYIWMCLDHSDFLKAVHLYLFALHIHTGLELDTEHKVPEKFAILSRLKLSIISFRNRILDGIKIRLQAVNLNSEEASNYLCAYMLLENKSQEQVLLKFIELRHNALNDLLQFDISVHNVVRIQILNLMNCLICTISLLHSCFIDHNKLSDGLVQIQMKQILSPNVEKTISLVDLESSPLLNYIPALVKDFRPSCTEGQKLLSKDAVQKIINSWLQSSVEIINMNLSKSLELITSVKALQNIREEAYKIETVENWESICADTYLPSRFTVWYYFFQPLVSKRANKLISQRVENNLQYLFQKLNNAFQSCNDTDSSERDLRWYVWHESPNDILKDKNEHPGLAMKTKGHSTRIVTLCTEMNEKYLELIQDVDIYLFGTEKNSKLMTVTPESCSERKHLETHLRKETSLSIEKLINYVDNIIKTEADSSTKVVKSVMAARLLQAISQLCPNLVKSCSYGDCTQDWEAVHSSLVNKTLQFWGDWINATKNDIENILKQFLISIQYHNMLQILPRWNTIEIEEQTEDKVFNSEIRIPSQPSVILLNVLSDISSLLNSIIPQTLPKSIHLQFTENVADLILQRYQRLCSEGSLNQNMALQFLLDVKFLTTICVKRDNKNLMKKSQDICDDLRSKIDPFDLDVFYPYLQTHVKRSVVQSQAFFGCFLPASAQLASLGTVESKSADNEPCIIALSIPTTEAWFPLLPVTAPILKTINIPSVTVDKQQVPKKEFLLTKEETESSSGTTFVRSGAAALFGAMTNDWFS